jgi:hypothetical protein
MIRQFRIEISIYLSTVLVMENSPNHLKVPRMSALRNRLSGADGVVAPVTSAHSVVKTNPWTDWF